MPQKIACEGKCQIPPLTSILLEQNYPRYLLMSMEMDNALVWAKPKFGQNELKNTKWSNKTIRQINIIQANPMYHGL